MLRIVEATLLTLIGKGPQRQRSTSQPAANRRGPRVAWVFADLIIRND